MDTRPKEVEGECNIDSQEGKKKNRSRGNKRSMKSNGRRLRRTDQERRRTFTHEFLGCFCICLVLFWLGFVCRGKTCKVPNARHKVRHEWGSDLNEEQPEREILEERALFGIETPSRALSVQQCSSEHHVPSR